MPQITISYRRDDSLDVTGRIFDRLAEHFGREAVFRDIDNIPPGADFRRHIDRVLEESDIVLAVVGPRWIGPDDEHRRLANPADPVRLEIETALRKDKPLIPVLVSRAVMPQLEALPDSIHDFAYRNAIQIDSGQDFDVHVGRLIRAMEGILEPTPKAEPAHRSGGPPAGGGTTRGRGAGSGGARAGRAGRALAGNPRRDQAQGSAGWPTTPGEAGPHPPLGDRARDRPHPPHPPQGDRARDRPHPPLGDRAGPSTAPRNPLLRHRARALGVRHHAAWCLPDAQYRYRQ